MSQQAHPEQASTGQPSIAPVSVTLTALDPEDDGGFADFLAEHFAPGTRVTVEASGLFFYADVTSIDPSPVAAPATSADPIPEQGAGPDAANDTRTVTPVVTPVSERKKTCPVARFGRPHRWTTGFFYWPLHADGPRQAYTGEDYVMCGLCGQIEEDF